MKPFQYFADCLSLFVSIPIWYFLVYSILLAIHPDRLVWFLFWVYVPVGIVAASIRVIAERIEKSEKGTQQAERDSEFRN